jgi:hypothetical protein
MMPFYQRNQADDAEATTLVLGIGPGEYPRMFYFPSAYGRTTAPVALVDEVSGALRLL